MTEALALSSRVDSEYIGLQLMGMTAEWAADAGMPETAVLLEAACDVVPQDAVVIAGTGTESTRHTIRLTRQAADAHVRC